MSLPCIIDRHSERFSAMNDRAQQIVLRRLRAMRIILSAKNTAAGIREARPLFEGRVGASNKRLHALVKTFKASGGDWTVLVNRSIAGARWQSFRKFSAVPDALIDHLAEEWSLRQRDKFRVVHQALAERLDRWRRGDASSAIPGYAEPPHAARVNGLPAGWSEDNLKRAVEPRVSKFTRRLIQVGPKSAYLEHAPHVLSTRVGVEVGEYYFADDSWNDFKVMAFGQTVRLLSFHILDLASGCNVKRGYKPALTDEHDIERRLKMREMIWLGVSHLQSNGYREQGTTFCMEKATATFPPEFDAILADFGIPITIQRGPRGGGPGIDALFTGPSGGTPRWKAPMESWFNGLRNRTDHLLEFPGQVGSYSSGLPSPEGLPGLERDTRALIAAARALPLDKAERMMLGLLNSNDAMLGLDRVTELYNFRMTHNLEGWRKCGNVVVEWRPHASSLWLPDTDLISDKYSLAERHAFAAIIAANPLLKRERNLSPAEVFYPRAAHLKKLPLHVAAALMALVPPESTELECTVQRGVIPVRCREIDPDEELRFGLSRYDDRGMKENLRDGDKYLVRVNGCDPSRAYLYKSDGGFAGAANFYGRESRAEIQTNHRQFNEKRQWLATQTNDARFITSRVTKADITRTANNSAVVAEQKQEVANVRAEALANLMAD